MVVFTKPGIGLSQSAPWAEAWPELLGRETVTPLPTAHLVLVDADVGERPDDDALRTFWKAACNPRLEAWDDSCDRLDRRNRRRQESGLGDVGGQGGHRGRC